MTERNSKTRIPVIYIHGYGGTNEPGGVADQLAQALGDQFSIIAPVYDPVAPDAAIDMFTSSIKSEKNKEVLLVGNSLGGFFANYLCLQHRCKTLLVNPLLHPGEHLRARGIGAEIVHRYERLEQLVAQVPPIARRIVLVGDEDDVVDPHGNGYALGKSAEVISIPMGHKLTDIASAVNLIRRLSSRSSYIMNP